MFGYCNPINCPAYALGWCEYDVFEDRIYPVEPNICPLMKEEQNG